MRTVALLLILLTGCISKPRASSKPEKPETPLAIGDCVVLEPAHRLFVEDSWRQTIDSDGYINAPLLGKLRIAGKTPTEARDFITSEYGGRNILGRAPELLLQRCGDYDVRERLSIKLPRSDRD